MGKKYYVNTREDYTGWRGFLALQEKDITKKIELQGLVYVEKEKIEDIEEYHWENVESSESMDLENAKEYIFTNAEETFTREEREYILNGWFEEDYTEEEEQEKIKIIIEKMKKDFVNYDYLETYLAYEYWDGSNWKEETLKHYFYDVEWEDYTEELEGMKEIDYQEYNTGNYTMYRTKENELVMVNISYYQGEGEAIYFLDNNNYTTIDEAFEEEINKNC